MANNRTQPLGAERQKDSPASDIFRPDQLGREVERLATAVVRSNAQLLIGTTTVIGNLLTNLNQLVLTRALEGFRPGEAPNVSSGLGRALGGVRIEDAASRSAGIVEGLSEALTEAVRESATVLSRSLEDFSRAYDDELGRAWRPGQPRESGGHSSTSSK
jgi:hypothetical protein